MKLSMPALFYFLTFQLRFCRGLRLYPLRHLLLPLDLFMAYGYGYNTAFGAWVLRKRIERLERRLGIHVQS